MKKQESIPVGWVPRACQPYVLWQWPPDVSIGGGSQVHKFEQVSGGGHQMSLAGGAGADGSVQ